MKPLTKDSWVVLGVLAIMVTAAVILVYLPQGRRIEEIQTRIATKKLALESDSQKTRVIPEMARQVRRMCTRYKHFDRKLPRQQDLGPFLGEISRQLRQEDLSNQLIEPGNPTQEELFHTLPIIMRFRGCYPSLVSFLDRIDKMQRLTRVQKLSIETGKASRKKTAQDNELDIEMRLNIYFTRS